MRKLYAHEGCYLALPDRAYDHVASPYVITGLLEREAEWLKNEIRGAAAMGFDGFVQLFSGIDDLVAYSWLDHPDGERREIRVAAIAKVQRDLVETAHGLGLNYYLQNYDLMLDVWVADQVSDGTIEEILRGRFREVFERTGCDGLVVTPSEAYNRGSSRWVPLFAGADETARMARIYHQIIVKELGKELRFRLWLLAEDQERWDALEKTLPEEVIFSVKNTSGDFWIETPPNPALNSKARLSVIFDSFHQYHGWGKLLALDPMWPEEVASCLRHNTEEFQIWGSWAPGCIWPNEQDIYLDGPSATWVGVYWENGIWHDDAPMAKLNIRYLAALSEGSSQGEALRQACMEEGFANEAETICQAAEPIEQWWRELYLPIGGQRYELISGWASIFQSPRKTWRKALSLHGPAAIMESTQRMQIASELVRKLGEKWTSPRLVKLWKRSLLFFETHEAIRRAVLADPALVPECERSDTLVAARCLRELADRWREDFPVEGRLWQMTSDYPMGTRPTFLRRGSLAEYALSLPGRTPEDIPAGEPWAIKAWDWTKEHH